jgi:hypothetical protein
MIDSKKWERIKRFSRLARIVMLGLLLYYGLVLTIKYGQKILSYPIVVDVPETRHINAGEAEVVIFALGDTGTGTIYQFEVAGAMEQRCRKTKPHGILLLGDLVYPNGTETLDDERWDQLIFDMYGGDCLKDVPIFPALGNHDYNGTPLLWEKAHALSERWWFPYRHYRVEFGDLISVLAVDTTNPTFIHTALPSITDRKSTTWSVAFGHHPIRSENRKEGSHQGGRFKGWLLQAALCNYIDSYIAGHSHYLEHITIDNCGTDQFVSGAGGAALHAFNSNPDYLFGQATHGFLEIKAGPETLGFTFVSSNGDVLYRHNKTIHSHSLADNK